MDRRKCTVLPLYTNHLDKEISSQVFVPMGLLTVSFYYNNCAASQDPQHGGLESPMGA